MDIRIRRPYSQAIDEALERGESHIGVGGGLYLRRMSEDLDGAFNVRPEGRDVFRVTRTEEAVRKIDETAHFAKYERLGKKWKDLL